MNPRITKEFKALLPAFVLTLAAAAMPLVIGPNRHELPEIWMGVLFALGCLIMGAEAFGNEFQQKTLPLLLTQPLPRTTIWKEKMRVLGGALTVGTGAFGVTIMVFDRQVVSAPDFSWMAWLLVPVGIFCTTPFWTMLLRNTLLGGLFTVVAPGLILSINSYLHHRWLENGNFIFKGWFVANAYLHQKWIHDPSAEEGSVITLLVLYCGACCWLGYIRFRKLQVVDAHSMAARELGLPPRFEALLLRPFETLFAKFNGPFASLFKKELRLQQITFLSAALFCLVSVIGAVLLQITHDGKPGHDWGVGLLLADFYFYMAVLPFIAGAVAVAEEKAWGVADWHLTLPPSAGQQWSAKVLVALTTSLLLGLVLPAVLAIAGTALLGGHASSDELPRFHALRSAINGISGGHPSSLAPMSLALVFLFCIVLGQMLLTSVAIYAGSITSNTSRALALAVGIVIGTGTLLGALSPQHRPEADVVRQLVHNPKAVAVLLILVMFLPLCLIHYLAYRCYRTRGLAPKVLRFQVALLVLLLSLFPIAFAALRVTIRTVDNAGP